MVWGTCSPPPPPPPLSPTPALIGRAFVTLDWWRPARVFFVFLALCRQLGEECPLPLNNTAVKSLETIPLPDPLTSGGWRQRATQPGWRLGGAAGLLHSDTLMKHSSVIAANVCVCVGASDLFCIPRTTQSNVTPPRDQPIRGLRGATWLAKTPELPEPPRLFKYTKLCDSMFSTSITYDCTLYVHYLYWWYISNFSRFFMYFMYFTYFIYSSDIMAAGVAQLDFCSTNIIYVLICIKLFFMSTP